MTKSDLLLSFVLVFAPVWAPAVQAQQSPIVLSSDKLEFSIGTPGGRFLKIVRRGAEPLSPLAAMGHFLALDGFGAASEQEQALGMPFHGEASRQPVKIIARNDSGPLRSITLQSTLPLAQETLEAEDFRWLGETIRNMGIPAFSVLEGGYSGELPELILAYLRGLAGAD